MSQKGNINLTISANSNLGNTTAHLEAMRRGMALLRAETERYYKQLGTTGKRDEARFHGINDLIDDTRKHYRSIIQESGQFATATRTLTSQTTDFNNQLNQNKLRLKDVLGQRKLINAAMREQMALHKMTVSSFRRDATGQISADIAVPTQLDLKTMDNMNVKMGYYNRLLHSVSIGTVNWGKNTQWAGRQLTVGFSVPITIAAGLLGRLGASADAELVRITKVYGDTESAFQASNESLRNMAQETALYVANQYGIAASETRKVMAELAATGLEGPELQSMTQGVQRTALLGDLTSDEALKLNRILKEVYGFSSQELEKQVNYFNAIENATALTMQDITEGIPRIAGIMKATGVSIKEQTELLVAFKSAGIDVAEGANALKSINFKAVAATPTAAKSFFRITGVEMESLIDKTEGEFLPMMMEIANVMKTLDQQAKVDLIARVFGIHQGSRAITLLEQLSQGSEGMLRAQEIGLKNSVELANTANRELGDIQQSASVRFKAMIESAKAALEPLGILVLEAVVPVGNFFVRFFKWVNGLPEATKKMGLIAAAFLTIVGPGTMLIGLFANLIGMGGRGIAAIAGLALQFEILNPKSKAAALIQKMLDDEAQQTNRTLNEQTVILGKVAQAIETVNESIRRKMGVESEHNAMVARALGIPTAATETAMATNPYVTSGRGTASSRRATRGQGAPGAPAGGRVSRRATRPAGSPEGTFGPDPAIAIEQTTEKLEAHREEVRKTERSWTRMGQTVTATFGAISGIAMMSGNQTLATISMIGMGISGFAPLMGTVTDRVGKHLTKMSTAGTGNAKKISTALKDAATSAQGAFGRLAAYVMTPWGLAIGTGIALVTMAWAAHKKQMDEIRDTYRGLADSAELLGKSYDFMPMSSMERAQAEGVYDSNTLQGQKTRIEEMKRSNTELYDLLRKKSEQIVDQYGQEELSREAANEALRQGAAVLRETGDPAKAKQVAWDVYNIISGELATFDNFRKEVELDVVVNLDNSQLAAARIAEDLEARLSGIELNWRGGLRVVDEEAIKADVKSVLQSIQDIPDPFKRNEMLMSSLGRLTEAQKVFFNAQKEGWIESDVTFADFATNIDDFYGSYKGSTRRSDKIFQGVSLEDAKVWQAMAEAVYDVDTSAMAAVSNSNIDLIEALSGVNAAYRENLDTVKISQLEDERAAGASANRSAQIDEEITALKNKAWQEAVTASATDQASRASEAAANAAKTGIDTLNYIASGGLNPIKAWGQEGAEGIEAITDEAFEAKDALEDLSEVERMTYDAYKSSMEHLTNQTVDYYIEQAEMLMDAERDKFDQQAELSMKRIENEHEKAAELAEAEAKARQSAMRDLHEAQREAMDDEKKAAQKAMEAAHKAEVKAFDIRRKAAQAAQKAEREALNKRFKRLDEELQESQEARREAIEASWDAQIERIEKQIETEERLEEQRQRMYEAEQERFRRLQQMFTSNIDLNMAINTGDLDEAARIASDISTRQSEWATQDLSQISSDASDSRTDRMRGQIDTLEERKEAELERIKEVEEAEQAALDARQEREEAALEKRFEQIEAELDKEREAIDAAQQAAKEALDEDFSERAKALQRRQQQQQEALDIELEAEKQRLADARDAAKAAEEQRTADARAELDKRIADDKASMAEHERFWRAMVARDFDGWKANNAAMHADFEQVLGIDLNEMDARYAQDLWNNRKEKQSQELRILANDKAWKDAARDIIDGITRGTLGISFSYSEFERFMRRGELPKEKKAVNTGGSDRTRAQVYHTGGIAGVTEGGRSGPGFYGPSQEIDATLLKGEGILNLRAMNQPGVPEMVSALNHGFTNSNPVASFVGHDGRAPSNKAGGSAVPSMMGVMAGIMTGYMKQLATTAAITGLEVGMSKAEQTTGTLNFDMGVDQVRQLSAEQLANASAIISTGRRLGATDNDIITALMTAMQESSMRNLEYGDDIHGVTNPDGSLTSSLGLFQQQNWWGTRGERLDPYKSSELFYRALFKVPNRNEMANWQAAQEVQRSAYPQAYAKWESMARVLHGAVGEEGVDVNTHLSTEERLKKLRERWQQYEESSKGFMYPTTGEISWLYGWRNMAAMGRRDFHNAIDIRAPGGTPVYAPHDGRARTGWDASGGGNYVYVDGPGGVTTGYFHLSRKVAKPGDAIKRGEYIGDVGNTGKLSFGNHLHFAVLSNGQFVDPAPFMNSEPYVGKRVRPQGILGMRNGGLVPGSGFGDIRPAMLEPGEFVMKKRVVDRNRELLDSLNNETFDVKSMGRYVDNSSDNKYNVVINNNGTVSSQIDFERGVRNVLESIEKKKPQSRSVRRG